MKGKPILIEVLESDDYYFLCHYLKLPEDVKRKIREVSYGELKKKRTIQDHE